MFFEVNLFFISPFFPHLVIEAESPIETYLGSHILLQFVYKKS